MYTINMRGEKMSILELKNVTKKFGRKTIIDDMSFTVETGEVYGFLGPNGSGKTTVIKMIMGLLKITKGQIFVDGHDVVKEYEKASKSFGGIIENPEMYGELKGITNLKVFSTLYPNVTEERINEIVEIVGLKDRINEPIKKYSLGMRQRLGLALALVHNPKLLILDEPTNGLDPKGIKELRTILRELTKQGTSVFVSSHLLSEMELMCDRVCIISKGKVVEIKDLKKSKIEALDETTGSEIYEFVYETDNDSEAISIANKYKYKCEQDGRGRLIVHDTKQNNAKLIKEIVTQRVNIFTVGIVSKSLEELYMETTEKKGKVK